MQEFIPTGVKIFDTEFYIREGEDLEKVRHGMETVFLKAKAFDAVHADPLELTDGFDIEVELE